MGWFKKDEPDLPEALKGKTEEEIAQIVANAEAGQAKVAELEARVAESDARFEGVSGKLTELSSKFESLTNPPGRSENRQESTSFLVDPDRAFAERAAPLVQLVIGTSGQLAKQEAMRQAALRERTVKNNIDGRLFEKFENEIMELAKGCSPQQLAVAATWDHLFFNVKGRHADEIASQNRDHSGEFFVESAQRTPAGDPAGGDKLTEQQLRIAAKMGVTPEAYLKNQKEMTAVPGGF